MEGAVVTDHAVLDRQGLRSMNLGQAVSRGLGTPWQTAQPQVTLANDAPQPGKGLQQFILTISCFFQHRS